MNERKSGKSERSGGIRLQRNGYGRKRLSVDLGKYFLWRGNTIARWI